MQNSKGIYPRVRVARDYPFETEQSPILHYCNTFFTIPFIFIRNFVLNFTAHVKYTAL